MPISTFHSLLQGLAKHNKRRSTFLKHFESLKQACHSLVAMPEATELGLSMKPDRNTSDAFRLDFAGRDFSFAMRWPIQGDGGRAAIVVSEVITVNSVETLCEVLKIGYSGQGTTDERGYDNDELELSSEHDARTLILHALQSAVST